MAEQPEVTTSKGKVRGIGATQLSVFRGIPYARALKGAAMYQAPESALPWEGELMADAFGPRPPQHPIGLPLPQQAKLSTHREPGEVLTVNVWAPEASGAPRPVMVWFYGGAYRIGYADDPMYDGALLAAEGNVVVVTVNYRVGAAGYLALTDAPNNRATLDQILALTWVRDEIAAFGGDPSQVTIFGESAGAGSVVALLVAPAAEGLFSKAIAQSVPATFLGSALATDIASEMLAGSGIEPTSTALAAVGHDRVTELVEALVARQPAMLKWGAVTVGPTPFSPVMDGDTIALDAWRALSSGKSGNVPLLVGHNRDEWRFFQSLMGQLESVPKQMVSHVAYIWGPGERKTADSRQRAARPGLSDVDLFSVEMSDGLFRMPSINIGTAHDTGGGTTFLYELTWSAPVLNGALGACHSLDVPLVFGTLTSAPMLLGKEPSVETLEVSRQMRASWLAFAATGNPGWEHIHGADMPTRVFDGKLEPTVTDYPETASRTLWAGTPSATLQLKRLSIGEKIRGRVIGAALARESRRAAH
jgi:para-nitrobenzyl esterase